MFDIKSLTSYVTTVNRASFAGAATELGVSKTTVINGVRRLEGLLSMPLLLRTKKGVMQATGTQPVFHFCLVLLSALLEIEKNTQTGMNHLDIGQLIALAAHLPKHDDELTDFLSECTSLRISPKLLGRFVSVYEYRSINRGALECGIAQPQISRQIGELEEILNAKLFKRRSSGLETLPAANALYSVATQLSAYCEQAIERGELLFAKEMQTTRLGSVPPFSSQSDLCNLICDICTKWSDTIPNSHVHVSTGPTNSLLMELNNDKLHAAIIDSPDFTQDFSERITARHPLVLAGDAGGIVKSRDCVDQRIVSRLIRQNAFVLPSRHTGLRIEIDKWLEKHAIRPKTVLEVDSMTVLAALTRGGKYFTLLPSGAFPDKQAGIEIHEIPDAPVLVQRLIWKTKLSHIRPILFLHRLLDSLDANEPDYI